MFHEFNELWVAGKRVKKSFLNSKPVTRNMLFVFVIITDSAEEPTKKPPSLSDMGGGFCLFDH